MKMKLHALFYAVFLFLDGDNERNSGTLCPAGIWKGVQGKFFSETMQVKQLRGSVYIYEFICTELSIIH